MSSSAGASRHFDALAADYDSLRPADRNWWELFDALVAEGDLLGRRVLDAGCGTGRFAAALAERGAKVWGVDPSEAMLARAREAAGARVGLKRASAEALPFRDGWFERAVLRQVVHLVDRERAFPELARVLGAGGRLVVATFAPEHVERSWLAGLFPSVARIDRERFPDPADLRRELEAAGFRAARVGILRQEAALARDEALARLRGRFVSTLRMIGDDELRRGLARAERELPEEVRYPLVWALVSADA